MRVLLTMGGLRILAVALTLLVSPTLAYETQQYNIYTVDKHMNSFGDLISNWLVALHIRDLSNDQVTVNFYVSQPFHERFGNVEPAFDVARRVQQIRGINVFAWTNDGTSQAEHATLENLGGPEPVCNLAFTVDAVETVLRSTPVAGHPAWGNTALTHDILEATAGAQEKEIPFLFFSVFLNSGSDRLPIAGHGVNATRIVQGDRRRPFFWLRTSLANKHLFISREGQQRTSGRLSMGTHYMAYAHGGPQTLRTYLELVTRVALHNPERTFAVVATRPFMDETRTEGNTAHEMAINTALATGVPRPLVAVDAAGSVLAEDVAGEQYPYTDYYVRDNLIVREYNAVPFEDTNRLIAGSNFPVLVTGTLSLSQAMQYDKPFIYEVAPWHAEVSMDIGRFVTGDNALARAVLILGPNTQPFLNWTNAGPLEEVADRREEFLFGLSGSLHDWEMARHRYEQVKQRLRQYRLEHVMGEPRGHLLDNVFRYCDSARHTYRRVRTECSGTGNDMNCVFDRLGELNSQMQ